MIWPLLTCWKCRKTPTNESV